MLRTYRNWKHGLGTLSHCNGNGGKLDKYVGILRIVKNALILINGNKIIFQMSVELYTSWELLHTWYSRATYIWRATIQVISRRVGIYY